MRAIMLSTMVAGVSVIAGAGAQVGQPTAVILGTVRAAVTRTPVAGASIQAGPGSDAIKSDSAGRFVLHVPRTASLLRFQRSGYLDFQYPLLRLTRDTLVADVELRADPPTSASYAPNGALPFLCVVLDAPDRMTVSNGCYPDSFPHPASEYKRQGFKYNPDANPDGPYFGKAFENGGVLVYTRVAAPR